MWNGRGILPSSVLQVKSLRQFLANLVLDLGSCHMHGIQGSESKD